MTSSTNGFACVSEANTSPEQLKRRNSVRVLEFNETPQLAPECVATSGVGRGRSLRPAVELERLLFPRREVGRTACDREGSKCQLRFLSRGRRLREGLRLRVTPMAERHLGARERERGRVQAQSRGECAPGLDRGEPRGVQKLVEGTEQKRLEIRGCPPPANPGGDGTPLLCL